MSTDADRSPDGSAMPADILRLVLDNIPHCVFWKDRQSRYLGFNRVVAESFGVEAELIRGKTDHEVLGPGAAQADAFVAMDRQVMERNEPQFGILEQLTSADGSTLWLETTKVPMRDASGAVIGVLGMAQDITQRRRAELRDRKQRGILEQLARGEPLPVLMASIISAVEQESPQAFASIVLLDPTGRRLQHGCAPRLPAFYNEAVHGLEIGDGVGSCGTAAFTKKRVIVEDIETHPYWEPARELTRKAGLRSCWSEPIVSSSGKVLGTFAIYHATPKLPTADELEFIAIAAHLACIAIERTQAVESLRLSEEKYRDLVENANDLIQCVDIDGRFVFVNNAWQKTLGYREDEVGSLTIWDVLHPDSRELYERLLAECMSNGMTSHPRIEIQFVTKQSRRIDLEGNISVRQADGKFLHTRGIFRNVTDRKRAEEERQKLEVQIQHTQKLESLGVLAGGIAHDFNNILTGILGYADLALLELPTHSPARSLIGEAVNAARKAADLTKQMLAYSGKGKFVVQALDLNDVVEDMVHLLQVSISKKCVLKYDFMKNLPAIEADPVQMRQILMNLIINASEAIGERSGVIAVTTGAMHCDRAYLSEAYLDEGLVEGLYVFLEVADTGCGMSEETRARIFDPFFTTKFTGRGLGLSAVLGIVRGHRGAVKVYSEWGKGTTFKVAFPATNLAVVTDRKGKPPEPAWRGSGTVLIVDDEETVRGLARHMLARMGFTVLTAADGREGVEVFRSAADQIRLVLLDMTMPRLDGEETFREMRRIRSDVKAILSSGYNEQSATNRFAGKGLAGFIQKPYRYEELMAIVRAVLGNETDAAP
jgi:PAS domain S-box-containing protein